MSKIFVDTWAWYALVDTVDNDHALAQLTNAELLNNDDTFVTTNFVLAEAVTLIRYKLHHAATVRFWQHVQTLIELELVELVGVNIAHEAAAWEIFERYADAKFSYTDCTSFAVMQDLKLTHVFTRDHHFAILGFVLVP